jgi:hypothetical protein
MKPVLGAFLVTIVLVLVVTSPGSLRDEKDDPQGLHPEGPIVALTDDPDATSAIESVAASGAALDACTLLTGLEIAGAMGQLPADGTGASAPPQSSCVWRFEADDERLVLRLTVEVFANEAAARRFWRVFLEDSGFLAVDGVGDGAFDACARSIHTPVSLTQTATTPAWCGVHGAHTDLRVLHATPSSTPPAVLTLRVESMTDAAAVSAGRWAAQLAPLVLSQLP